MPRHVLFVGLNPSTADDATDDPTVRRCVGFARDWGYEGLTVCNLFAFRSPDPKRLWRTYVAGGNPVGPENDRVLYEAASLATCVVACWGVHGVLMNRGREVADRLRAAAGRLWCLGLSKGGAPKHPLYLARGTALEPFA